jgi:hypothetical protein
MMCLSEECDNKREDKHTARQLPDQYHVPRTRPHVAPGSQFHHRCAAKLPLCRHLRSDEEHRPYSARHSQTRRDGKAPHRAYNAQVSRVVGLWVPRRLKRPNHEIYSVPAIAGVEMKSVPNGMSSSGGNLTGLLILITPPAAASYRKRLRWRTRTGGSASMSICWLVSLKPDGPSSSCMDCDWETRMRAS